MLSKVLSSGVTVLITFKSLSLSIILRSLMLVHTWINFVTFKPKMNANRVYKRLLDKGIVIKNLGNLPVVGHCLRVTVGLPYMNARFLNALKDILA